MDTSTLRSVRSARQAASTPSPTRTSAHPARLDSTLKLSAHSPAMRVLQVPSPQKRELYRVQRVRRVAPLEMEELWSAMLVLLGPSLIHLERSLVTFALQVRRQRDVFVSNNINAAIDIIFQFFPGVNNTKEAGIKC